MTQQFLGKLHVGPAQTREWQAGRRVASRPVFEFYCEHTLAESVTPRFVLEQMLGTGADEASVGALFDGIPDSQVRDCVRRLRDLVFDGHACEPELLVRECIRWYARLGTSPRLAVGGGVFELNALVSELLRQKGDAAQRQALAEAVFTESESLSIAWYVASVLTGAANTDRPVVPVAFSQELVSGLCVQVRGSTVEQLESEFALCSLLSSALDDGNGDRDWLDVLLADEPFVLAVLVGALIWGVSVVDTSSPLVPDLDRALLHHIFGSRGALESAIEWVSGRADRPELVRLALGLARGEVPSQAEGQIWDYLNPTTFPSNFLAPQRARYPEPFLLLRVAIVFDIASEALRALHADPAFWSGLVRGADSGDVAHALLEVATLHGFALAVPGGWEVENETATLPSLRVIRNSVTASGGEHVLITARQALGWRTEQRQARSLVDIVIPSLDTEDAEPSARGIGMVSIVDLARLFEAALESSAVFVPGETLERALGGETPSRSAIEFYVQEFSSAATLAGC